MPLSIILIDDHPLFRKGLLHLLENRPEVTISAQFANAAELREWLQQDGRADVALLDRTLGEVDGLDLVPELHQRNIKIIMLTMAEEDHEIRDAMEKGVDGYLLKSSEPDQIIQSIIAVSKGNSIFPAQVLQKIARGELGPSLASRLSQRELEIVSYVARGLSNRAIGDTLGLSENTVRNHLRSILEKLEFDNRVQVATFALEHGLAKRTD
ncbi:MAG: response regulator transcription factor [Pseudomonadota bacterium]|nr:response regulator transcription factor [Gammaproteobacteria bacterium]MBU1732947.1 response regulator transcription factor [Gammaproteobacteria bacterium]MBU1891995.1 response regulator transcription factor [Gammaproteobacteria bacterium]